ncbi:hypothetical protein HYDPIDRAFT_107385, partial [Hydnomerulius pinastri MD-312]
MGSDETGCESERARAEIHAATGNNKNLVSFQKGKKEEGSRTRFGKGEGEGEEESPGRRRRNNG